ncbi:MAG: hypothetical protein QF767_09815 [Alphaproteobacteria bacterium]|jgi:hypothetical protein|nr:hypothetical protein [Alphaproteobacteria bacterium]
MARKRNDLFKRAEAELYALGGEISKRKSAEAEGANLTAKMRAASFMLRAGLDCHGTQARDLSLEMLTNTLDAAGRDKESPGRQGLKLRTQADKMVQAVLDVESAIR